MIELTDSAPPGGSSLYADHRFPNGGERRTGSSFPDAEPATVTRIVVIDSLNAYLQSMPNEQFLILQMHELLSYLGQLGVVSLLILGLHRVMNDIRSDVYLSYLADTVVQLRYFEAYGEVRQAISVIKARTARHERTIREYRIDDDGLAFGEPLRDFHGVLTGVPTFSGESKTLLASGAGAPSEGAG